MIQGTLRFKGKVTYAAFDNPSPDRVMDCQKLAWKPYLFGARVRGLCGWSCYLCTTDLSGPQGDNTTVALP
jgi:hypothetical protein